MKVGGLVIGKMIGEGNLRVRDLAGKVRTMTVDEKEVRIVDPAGDSFIDIDTPDDMEKARGLI